MNLILKKADFEIEISTDNKTINIKDVIGFTSLGGVSGFNYSDATEGGTPPLVVDGSNVAYPFIESTALFMRAFYMPYSSEDNADNKGVELTVERQTNIILDAVTLADTEEVGYEYTGQHFKINYDHDGYFYFQIVPFDVDPASPTGYYYDSSTGSIKDSSGTSVLLKDIIENVGYGELVFYKYHQSLFALCEVFSDLTKSFIEGKLEKMGKLYHHRMVIDVLNAGGLINFNTRGFLYNAQYIAEVLEEYIKTNKIPYSK